MVPEFTQKLYDIKNSDSKESRYKLILESNYYVINKLKEELKNIKRVNIVGKGQSAKFCEEGHASNQAIIFTNRRFLYLTDITGIFGIEHLLKDVEYIFFPDHPHVPPGTAYANVTFMDMLYLLKIFNFKGNIFIFQIRGSTKSPNYLNEFKFTVTSSGELPIHILQKFVDINEFNMYGVFGNQFLNYDYKYHPELQKVISINTIDDILKDKKIPKIGSYFYYENELIIYKALALKKF